MKNLVLLILLGSSIAVHAQFGQINGKVTDRASGSPLPYANITYTLNGSKQVTQADDNGNYKIKPLVPGSYDLEFTYTTFKPVPYKGITVSPDKITYINVAMIPDNDLPIVDIIWEPPMIDPEIPGNVHIIDADGIENSVARDVKNIVASAPGIYQRDDGGALNVRGSREQSTLYVVDGIKMYGDFSLPKNAISEIKVLTGGIPAQYGDATGGVVLITTRNFRKR
jgi:hypothetical protein